jgi:nicotinamidase-related amidase
MKPALLIIDVQQEFFKYSSGIAQSLKDAIEYINAAIDLFRKKQLPVICIQHMDEGDGLVPGTPGFELPAEVHIRGEDVHLHKTYGNSFNKTGLIEVLRERGVDTVILTGFCAEYCVLSTCRGAHAERVDLMSILLRGSLASTIPDNIPFVESIHNIISYSALKKVLE